jgi:hypothetical protein
LIAPDAKHEGAIRSVEVFLRRAFVIDKDELLTLRSTAQHGACFPVVVDVAWSGNDFRSMLASNVETARKGVTT